MKDTKKGAYQTGNPNIMTKEDLEAFLRLLLFVANQENKLQALDYTQHWLSSQSDNPAKDYFSEYISKNRPKNEDELAFFRWATNTETRLAFLDYARERALEDLQKLEQPEKKAWEQKIDELKGTHGISSGPVYFLHDNVVNNLLDVSAKRKNGKQALPALTQAGINSYIQITTASKDPKQRKPINIGRVLDYGDIGYYAACASLYKSDTKNKIFTPAMIYRRANGITDGSDVSDGMEDEVREFMTRCASYWGIIDKKKEYRQRLEEAEKDGNEEELRRLAEIVGDPNKLGYISEPLLVFKAHIDQELFDSTEEVKEICYEFISPPALLESALISGQLTSTPAEALDIREVKVQEDGTPIIGRRLRNSRDRMNIKYYLLNAVRIRKTEKNWPIPLDSIATQGQPGGYETNAANLPAREDGQLRYIREYARDVLAYWQAIGFIKNFRYSRTDKKFYVNEPKKERGNGKSKSAKSGHLDPNKWA